VNAWNTNAIALFTQRPWSYRNRWGRSNVMLRFLRDALITLIAVLVAVAGLVYLSVRKGGLSADDEPTRLETMVARRLLWLSVPAEAHRATNPHSDDPAAWREAAAHFADHCAVCHGRDGRGRTDVGRNMYPKVPDLTAPTVQHLSDGALYFIIQNGVRWTGMPAWRTEHTTDDTWKLVSFVRRMPSLTPRDFDELERSDSEVAQPAAPHHEHGQQPHDHVHPQTGGARPGTTRP
jgi:mono/diheme cytochrome c family protein